MKMLINHRREAKEMMMNQTPSAGTARILCFTSLLVSGGVLLMTGSSMPAQETRPVGKTPEDQQRNTVLLGDYDYTKYPTSSLTGYTGQDRQRVAFLSWQHAVRTRVGPRGGYKAGLTILPNGRLLLAACRNNNDQDPTKNRFVISVYESADQGLTWQDIGKTPLLGKEPSLTALPDGSLVLSAQKDYFGPGAKLDEIYTSRSTDGGRTWETQILPGSDYPRNMIIEPDGALLMIRALAYAGSGRGKGSPNLQLCRSKDGGKTWQFSEGIVDWDYSNFANFAEVSAIRLKSGRLLAALRRQPPGTSGHGFEDTMLTESSDEGKHWSKPRDMVNTAEVHVYLTELKDGRVLATYSNYHLPWGVYAIVSKDEGKSWDLDHPIQLALSAANYAGWPVTLQLADGSLITSYAITAYLKQPPETTVTEVVRWEMPAVASGGGEGQRGRRLPGAYP